MDADDKGRQQRSVVAPDRVFPVLVAGEAETGELRVYRRPALAVKQWHLARRRREAAAAAGTLERLRADERPLELKLVLAGEHGLTLPLPSSPWDGIQRQGEPRLLSRAIERERRQRRGAQLSIKAADRCAAVVGVLTQGEARRPSEAIQARAGPCG